PPLTRPADRAVEEVLPRVAGDLRGLRNPIDEIACGGLPRHSQDQRHAEKTEQEVHEETAAPGRSSLDHVAPCVVHRRLPSQKVLRYSMSAAFSSADSSVPYSQPS